MRSETPRILVAGVVHRLDRLRQLGDVRRADWSDLRKASAHDRIDLAVVGASPPHVDAVGVITHLKNDPVTSAIPVLHLVQSRAACVRCGADVCLSVDERPETMEGVARALVGLRRARHDAPPARAATRGRVPHAERFLKLMAEAARGFAYVYDVTLGRTAFVSPSVERVLGHSAMRLAASGFPLAPGLVHPEDRSRLANAWAAWLVAEDETIRENEFRVRSASGDWRTLRSREVLFRAGRGRVRRVLGVALDVTEEREARRMLERAQRLEALGRLTGGIAHDFNNMLGVITGHSQLVQRLLPSGHPASIGLDQVVKASERAAALTRQLLAFSREPSREQGPLDLEQVVAEVGEMLRRVIAEDVELEIRSGAGPATVAVPRMQLEQLLLNLALNARDAMPSGGRMRIETAERDVEPAEGARLAAPSGRYVVLVVSDTGIGMDAETRRRIFEPFFTTKPEGKGSGLGLATVREIVARWGGAIDVESEPGSGSTFRVYLPRVEPPRAETEAPPLSGVPEGTETVLLVEDADSVRDVTRELLQGLGYNVLSAASGDQALALARTHPGAIHVVLTDVVMPRLGGGTLATELLALRPQIRILYMSGYSSGPVPGAGEDGELLEKPFTRDRLARAIREAIDGVRR